MQASAQVPGRMESVANEGRTILFVSHNMGAISELCTRAILLDRGRKVADGSVSEIVNQYSRISSSGAQYSCDSTSIVRESTITGVRLLGDADQDTGVFDLGQSITVEIISSQW